MSVLSMLFSVLMVLLFLAALIFGFFLWINNRDAELEEASYEENFDHTKGISKQYRSRTDPDDPDPEESLKHYRVRMRESADDPNTKKKKEKSAD